MLEYDQAVPGGKPGGWPAAAGQRLWGPGAKASLPGPVQRPFDGRPVVGHAAGVVEQLVDGDPVAVGQDRWQPSLQGVRQRQPALPRPVAARRWQPATWSGCRPGSAARVASVGGPAGRPRHWRPAHRRARRGSTRPRRAPRPPRADPAAAVPPPSVHARPFAEFWPEAGAGRTGAPIGQAARPAVLVVIDDQERLPAVGAPGTGPAQQRTPRCPTGLCQ